MKRAIFLLCACAAASACSSTPAASTDAGAGGQCNATLSGNTEESGTADPCVSFAYQADAGTTGAWVLTVDFALTKLGRFKVVIDLGATPSSGRYTSASVADWWAVGVSATANCEFVGASGRSESSFDLSLSVAEDDAAAPTRAVHGTLTLQLPVQAGVDTDCGPGDVEYAAVTF